MNKKIIKYPTLLILAIIFVTPGITAYFFYHHPSLLAGTTTNKGTLLTPPIKLSSMQHTKKWKIIFWSPEPCDEACLKQLDVLARVRLALGRKLYQVDQWLILGEEKNDVSPQLTELVKSIDFHILASAQAQEQLKQLSTKPMIYIVNPDNYLVISYESGVKPDDVYKDLKLLLSTSEIKN